MLTPWKRIDCIKSFFYPSLQLLQRTDQISKTDWSMIDNTLKPLIKKTLGILLYSANEYLYRSGDDGLFGIPLATEDSDIALIDGGFELLTSNDKIIQKLAWNELVDVANCTNPPATLICTSI